jgi:hypothetical protein
MLPVRWRFIGGDDQQIIQVDNANTPWNLDLPTFRWRAILGQSGTSNTILSPGEPELFTAETAETAEIKFCHR